MFKFLRKYNKWIMVVGGSLLMITFIAPQLIQQFGGGNPMQQIVGSYDGGNVDSGQIRRANQELDIAASLAPNVVTRIGIRGGTHWFLLTTLAERNGFYGSVEDGRGFLELVARGAASEQSASFGIDTEQLTQVLLTGLEEQRLRLIEERGYTPMQVDLALARLRSIDRLIGAVSGEPMGSGIALSGPEFAAVGRKIFEQAQVSVAMFDRASPITGEVPEPTEADLQDLFKEYQSARASENEFGIGYYRDPAVAVEWVTITRARVNSSVVLDPVEVNKFYLRNRDRFPGELSAMRAQVEGQYRQARVDELMDAGVRAIRSELLRATRSLPLDGRFRVLPDDWSRQRPSMQALSEAARAAIADAAGTSASTPAATTETGLTTDMIEPSSLATLGQISGAFLRLGPRVVNFTELVLSVRELNPDTTIQLQRGLTFGPIEDVAGNRSFFRIIEVRPAGPAPILDVVRARVDADWRRLAAFRAISSESTMATIREVLVSEGIDAAGDLASRVAREVTVGRDSLVAAGGALSVEAIDTPAFRDAVLARVSGWDPTLPAGDHPMEERVLVVPIPETLTVAGVVITEYYPATRERVRQADGTISFAARDRLRATVTAPMLSFEALAEAMDFRAVQTAEQREAEELDAMLENEESAGE